MRIAVVVAYVLAAGVCPAQSNAPSSSTDAPAVPKPVAPKKTRPLQTAAQLQAALDQLTQANRDLIDLLKQQQKVLEDIQYDRRLQSRQIASLETRLADAMTLNSQLQKQVASLEAEKSVRQSVGAVPGPVALTNAPAIAANPSAPTTNPPPDSATNTPPDDTAANPPLPATYLPPAGSDGPPGTMTWHRLVTLKGTEAKQTDLFHIQGKTWRVVWHNQDKPGKVYANTSALFINAFPRDDTIPQKVCAKLGSGGDKTELLGPGNYYLKIEASGGSWELAVEDFR